MFRLPTLLLILLLGMLAACSVPPAPNGQPVLTPALKTLPVPAWTAIDLAYPMLLDVPPTPPAAAISLQPEHQSPDPTAASERISLCSPLEGIPPSELPEIISAPYDPPPPGREERHHGVDFSFYQRGERSSIEGVAVQSVLSGTVAAALNDRYPYGNMLIIETKYTEIPEGIQLDINIKPGESLYMLYAHMEQAPTINVGEMVQACRLIGSVGKSGNAGISHLHMEARIGPQAAQFAGMAYYLVQSTQAERDAYVYWRTSGTFRHFDPMLILPKFAR